MDRSLTSKVTIIGHKHPDTDSVCSAIAYAWLKNRISDIPHEACCAGTINRETEFVLAYFGVPKPAVCEDVHPQLSDIAFRPQSGIHPETSVLDAWNLMRDVEINTLCITDDNNRLLGLISLKDMANANMDLLDTSMLGAARTSYRNILRTLKGKLLSGNPDSLVERGRICIGTSPEKMRERIHPGDVVLTSDQSDMQLCGICCGASCLIICCGAAPSDLVLRQAREHGCAIISTDYDTFQAARLISTAAPVRHLMVKENLLTFRMDTPLEEVEKTMARVRFQYFPVLDENGNYCGVVSRRNLLNLNRKRVILVDHNERSQAVDGLEEAEILEIIDHHRLGSPETDAPVVFRNMPVGCTATILYHIYMEHQITPPREIAGLMLSAILSDTLLFKSPTATLSDRNAAIALADLAEISIPEYASEMFEAGSDLTGKTAGDILFSDFKIFHFGGQSFGVGQACLMSEKACTAAEQMISPCLDAALAKAGVPVLFFMLTNAPEQRTKVLFSGKVAPEVLRLAFGEEVQGNHVVLPGVVSRKKQFLPAIKKAVSRM